MDLKKKRDREKEVLGGRCLKFTVGAIMEKKGFVRTVKAWKTIALKELIPVGI